jgi:hypothetical protein
MEVNSERNCYTKMVEAVCWKLWKMFVCGYIKALLLYFIYFLHLIHINYIEEKINIKPETMNWNSFKLLKHDFETEN